MTKPTAATDEPEVVETEEDKAELERLVTWFIQSRPQIAATFFVDKVECVNEKVYGIKRKVNNRGEIKVQVKPLV